MGVTMTYNQNFVSMFSSYVATSYQFDTMCLILRNYRNTLNCVAQQQLFMPIQNERTKAVYFALRGPGEGVPDIEKLKMYLMGNSSYRMFFLRVCSWNFINHLLKKM